VFYLAGEQFHDYGGGESESRKALNGAARTRRWSSAGDGAFGLYDARADRRAKRVMRAGGNWGVV
jgi:Rps23 Pro-64 3,4-dihydroxylase Tpa1-like proline 4-hydroxylase